MKNLKKLTYNERKLLESKGLNPDEWKKEKIVAGTLLYLRNPDTNSFKIVTMKEEGV